MNEIDHMGERLVVLEQKVEVLKTSYEKLERIAEDVHQIKLDITKKQNFVAGVVVGLSMAISGIIEGIKTLIHHLQN